MRVRRARGCRGKPANMPRSIVVMCPHATTYVSSFYRICVLRLLYMCPHTTTCVSSCYCICVLLLLYMCPQGEGLHGQNGKNASLNIRYMCPHTTIFVSSCYSMYICAQGEGLHGHNGKHASLHIRVAYGSSKYQGRDEAEGERAQSFIT